MVKFEFELYDVDAGTLFEVLNQEIQRCKDMLFYSQNELLYKSSTKEWYKNRVEYLSLLKTKLHNTRI